VKYLHITNDKKTAAPAAFITLIRIAFPPTIVIEQTLGEPGALVFAQVKSKVRLLDAGEHHRDTAIRARVPFDAIYSKIG
jgi:hypothetical protein